LYAPRVQEEEQKREEQENHIKEKETNRERLTDRERERERERHTHTHTHTHAKRKGKPKTNKILIAMKFRTSLELAPEPLTVLAACFFRKPASPTKSLVSLVSLVSVALLSSSLCNDNGEEHTTAAAAGANAAVTVCFFTDVSYLPFSKIRNIDGISVFSVKLQN
jgi:hypothetical protein